MPNGRSHDPALSSDGRFVAFYSSAKLGSVPNYGSDVFVHDRATRRTEMASISMTGTRGAGGVDPAISGQGRHIVFANSSSKLVAGDTNGRTDIFVRTPGPSIRTADTPRPGTRVHLTLTAPGSAGKSYRTACSFSNTPGIRVSGRVIPLNPDALFFLSVQNPWIFPSFAGLLNGSGQAAAAINLPRGSAFSGLTFYTAFLVLDPAAPSGVKAVLSALKLTVQ